MTNIKLIIFATILVLLSGCASFFPAEYDNNEYYILAKLETDVKLVKEMCAVSQQAVENEILGLVRSAELLHTYTFYIPRNTDVYNMATILKNDIREFEKNYAEGKGNTLYCKLKTSVFLKKVRITLKAVAQKVRN